MAFTAVLGTAASTLGNIVLGLGSGGDADGLGWLRRPRREAEAPAEEAAVRRGPWLTTVLPPAIVEQMAWRRRPVASDEPIQEEAAAKRKPWLPGPVWWPRRRTPGADEPAAPEPLPRRFGWPSPNLGGEWVVRPRRVFPEPQAWEWPPKPSMGWLPFAPPPTPACPYRPVRPDAGQARAGRPDDRLVYAAMCAWGGSWSPGGRNSWGGAWNGASKVLPFSIPGRPDASPTRAGRPDECR